MLFWLKVVVNEVQDVNYYDRQTNNFKQTVLNKLLSYKPVANLSLYTCAFSFLFLSKWVLVLNLFTHSGSL